MTNITINENLPPVNLSRRDLVRGLAAGSVVALLPACTYNEEIGRNQFVLVSRGQMAQLAGSTWTQLQRQEKVSRNPRYTTRLNRVAPRIIAAAGENPSAWDYAVFDSDQLNAFAMPGNKMGFYTGLMDIMDNDDQLATVVGHEVAHVRFNHSGERYSQQLAAQGIAIGTAIAAANTDSDTQRMISGVVGAGLTFGVILPFSRKHEFEADKFGVRYMHRANYNANESLDFWQSMMARGGSRPPAYLSTHPSNEQRIAQLRREISLLPPRV